MSPELRLFEKPDIARIATQLHRNITSDPKCQFSLDFHPIPEEQEFKSGAYWTLTAESPRHGLQLTMIVRGNPSWTRDILWFTQGGEEFTCWKEVFNETLEFRPLGTFLRTKADKLGQEYDRKIRSADKKRGAQNRAELRSEADRLIAALGEDSSTET